MAKQNGQAQKKLDDSVKKFTEAIAKKTKEMMRDLAVDTFLEAQRTIPSSSGNLSKSASFWTSDLGFKISYNTPYAYALHEGEAQKSAGTMGQHKSKVKSHKRKVGGKTVTVKEHIKTYKEGFKPVPVKGTTDQWTTKNMLFSQKRPSNKQGWVREAWKTVLKKQGRPTQALFETVEKQEGKEYPFVERRENGGLYFIA